MPRFGQNLFTSRLFADSDSISIFGFDAFNRFGAPVRRPAAARRLGRRLKLTAAFGNGRRPQAADLRQPGTTPDNYQPVESAWYIPGPTALVDVYTPDPNTTGTLVVDGAHVIAASDTPGDNDWFAVTLTAGANLPVRSICLCRRHSGRGRQRRPARRCLSRNLRF